MAITKELSLRIQERDNFRCVFCSQGIEDGVSLSIDHVIPQASFERGVATGDMDAVENLVTACTSCNSLKRDMDAEVFALYLRRCHGWTAQESSALKRRVAAAVKRPLPEE